jgi:hypothetical protein
MTRRRKILNDREEALAFSADLTNRGIIHEVHDGLGIFRGKKVITWIE